MTAGPSRRLQAAALVVALGGLALMGVGQDDGGTRAASAPTESGPPAPSVDLPPRTDESSTRFEDVTDAAGVAGAATSIRLTTLPDATDEEADALAAADPRAQVLATHPYLASGQAWGDYDQDGDADLYLTDQTGPNRLLENTGDGRFVADDRVAPDVALEAHLSGGATFVDYDNDGWPDLHVLGDGPDHLLHNDRGDGFTDTTYDAAIDDPGQGQTAAWADADGDGNLDAYVADGDGDQDHLFLNKGDGTFRDSTDVLAAFPATRGPGTGGAWLDYDGDGDPDLYGAGVLLRNDGSGCGGVCLTDVTAGSGADVGVDAHALAAEDVDGDGDPDVVVTSGGPTVLLLNRGDGTFRQEEVDPDGSAWGASFLDADGDGRLDIVLGVGLATPGLGADHTRLLRQQADGTFTSEALGDPDGPAPVHLGTAVGSLDGDGRPDVVLGTLDDGYVLLRNRATGTHRAVFDVRGDRFPVSRDGAGTQVVVTDDRGRTQTRTVRIGGSLGSGDDRLLVFGFGPTRPIAAEVRWSDGRVVQLDVDVTDRLVTVTDGPFAADVRTAPLG